MASIRLLVEHFVLIKLTLMLPIILIFLSTRVNGFSVCDLLAEEFRFTPSNIQTARATFLAVTEEIVSLYKQAVSRPDRASVYTKEIIRVMSAHLTSQGVAFMPDDSTTIRILPGNETPLNRFALALKSRYDTDYIFDSNAPLTGVGAGYSKERNRIQASIDTILNVTLQHAAEGHEEIHAIFEAYRTKKLPTVFDFFLERNQSESMLQTYSGYATSEEIIAGLYTILKLAQTYRASPSRYSYTRLNTNTRMFASVYADFKMLLEKTSLPSNVLTPKEMAVLVYKGSNLTRALALSETSRLRVKGIDLGEGMWGSSPFLVVGYSEEIIRDSGLMGKIKDAFPGQDFDDASYFKHLDLSENARGDIVLDFQFPSGGKRVSMTIDKTRLQSSRTFARTIEKYRMHWEAMNEELPPEKIQLLQSRLLNQTQQFSRMLDVLKRFPKLVELSKQGNPDMIIEEAEGLLQAAFEFTPSDFPFK